MTNLIRKLHKFLKNHSNKLFNMWEKIFLKIMIRNKQNKQIIKMQQKLYMQKEYIQWMIQELFKQWH